MPPRHRHSQRPTPHCRATINQSRIVTLNPWAPWLFDDVPTGPLFDDLVERGIVLADLTIIVGELGREVIVCFIPGDAATEEAAEAVLDWAATVGHRRVWLPDRVVDLGDTLVPAEPVESTCANCYTTWADSSPDFWAMVRKHGRFPGRCYVCAHALAEWQVPDVSQLELELAEEAA